MKIVFLDTATVDLGDIDLSPLKRLGEYQSFANSSPEEIIAKVQEADILITNKCSLRARELENLPNLKLICVAATGVNNIDLEAASRRGVAVANVAGYSTETVAEHTLLFLLALSHRLLEHHQSAVSGRWAYSPHFAVLDYPFSDLRGKTLGLIGYGAIGKKVARSAKMMGMKILIARIPGRRYGAQPHRVSLKALLKKSDFVTLHCPLTKSTHHLINHNSLKWMKSSAYLLNLARGAVVSEEDVSQALLHHRLAGYTTDVLSQEPPPENHPLFDQRLDGKVLITPHVAWASRESRQRLVDEIAGNVKAFKNGRKKNRIL